MVSTMLFAYLFVYRDEHMFVMSTCFPSIGPCAVRCSLQEELRKVEGFHNQQVEFLKEETNKLVAAHNLMVMVGTWLLWMIAGLRLALIEAMYCPVAHALSPAALFSLLRSTSGCSCHGKAPQSLHSS